MKNAVLKKEDCLGFKNPDVGSKHHILEPLGDSPNLSLEERMQWNQWNPQVLKLAAKYPDRFYLSGCVQEKVVCLTFDDAPDLKNTPDILDILKAYDVKASFSLVGRYSDWRPDISKRIFNEGHLVFNHTWNHPDLTKLDNEDIRKQVISTEKRIYNLFGVKTALIRPPYGLIDDRVAECLFDLGYRVALWSLNTFDWLEKTKDNIIKNVIEHVRPADVVLMHSYFNKEPTVEALPMIIQELRGRGYRFASLAEMFGVEPYK